MRQVPNYDQYVNYDDYGVPYIQTPMELMHELQKFRYVRWRDNGDGTYLVTPHNGED